MHNLGYARLRKKLENMVNNTITSQRQEKSSICQVISQNKELKNPPWFMLPKHMKYHISVPVLTYQDASLYTGSCKNTTTSQRQEKSSSICHVISQNKELKNSPWFMLLKHMAYHILVHVLTYQEASCRYSRT